MDRKKFISTNMSCIVNTNPESRFAAGAECARNPKPDSHHRLGRPEEYWQDCQIFKERCEDSPGILLLAHGDSAPTAGRLKALERFNYFVVSTSAGCSDTVNWLQYPVCVGALLHGKDIVNLAKAKFPDKVIERSDCIMLNMARTISQNPATILSMIDHHARASMPSCLKTIDIASCWSPVPLKRTELVIETALLGNLSTYIISQHFGSNGEVVSKINNVVTQYGATVHPVYLPFEPYVLYKIGERIILDGRPIGINNGIVPTILDRTRIYLHTSETEGIPNSITEALMRNVPVVICSDVKGPLIDIANEIPPAITISEPFPKAIEETVRKILTNYQDYNDVGEIFSGHFDPFEINRRFVKGCQEVFRKKNIPWKGHCQGLMGGMSAKFNIAEDIKGLEQAVGQRPIYPSDDGALDFLRNQIAIARSVKNNFAIEVLEDELRLIRDKLLCLSETKIY